MSHRVARARSGAIAMAIVLLLATANMVLATSVSAASSPFTGAWTSTDLDGSTQYLTISGGTQPEVGLTDLAAPGTCAGSPVSIFRGAFAGSVSGNTIQATVDSAHCGPLALDFLVGATFDFAYDPTTDTLFGLGVTWSR